MVTNKAKEKYNNNHRKQGSKIQLGCIQDNLIYGGQSRLYKGYTNTLVKKDFFIIPQNTTSKLLDSSKENPIKIAGIDDIFIHSSDHGNIPNVCGGAFKHIQTIED